MSQLVESGANLDMKSNNGMTALHAASIMGHLDCVRLLLKNNADPNIARKDDGNTALLAASLRGDTACVIELIKHGANVNHVMHHGATPLYAAVQNGHLAIVELLLKNGADIDATFKTSRIPVLAACYESYSHDVHSRMAKFIQMNFHLGEDDITITPEQIAQIMGNDDIIRALSVKREQINLRRSYNQPKNFPSTSINYRDVTAERHLRLFDFGLGLFPVHDPQPRPVPKPTFAGLKPGFLNRK